MKAVCLLEHGTPGRLEMRDVPTPTPGPGEVLLEVHACGLNHLDLWHEAGALPIRLHLPRIPGCEAAGRIVQLHPDVTGWEVGDRVVVTSNLACGACEYCRRGEESMCLNSEMFGVQRDGGLAEFAVAPARALARLPEGLDFISAAGLALAGSTAMHMLTNRTHARSGQWVLVMAGASGVGVAAIQIARALGCRVISTGSTPAKRQLAQELGAELVLDPADPNWPALVRRHTEKRGVDVVVEHIGGETLQQAFNCLGRGGTVVTCGATAGREVRLNLWPIFVKQQQFIGSYSRNLADLNATMEWAASGRLKPVIESTFPLEDTATAFDRLRARAVLGKLVARVR
jgi:2-desacetyl-2-hydroxyethyl bacteriochlorophyllide A dehydrogenase